MCAPTTSRPSTMALRIGCGDIVAICGSRMRGTILAGLVKRISVSEARIFVFHQFLFEDTQANGGKLPNSDLTISDVIKLTLQREAIIFILADHNYTSFVKSFAEVFITEDDNWKCASDLSRELGCALVPHDEYMHVNVIDNREDIGCAATL
jgi:hypothetical protein